MINGHIWDKYGVKPDEEFFVKHPNGYLEGGYYIDSKGQLLVVPNESMFFKQRLTHDEIRVVMKNIITEYLEVVTLENADESAQFSNDTEKSLTDDGKEEDVPDWAIALAEMGESIVSGIDTKELEDLLKVVKGEPTSDDIEAFKFYVKHGYRYIAMDKDELCYVYKTFPSKGENVGMWSICDGEVDYLTLSPHTPSCISRDDPEPYDMAAALKTWE